MGITLIARLFGAPRCARRALVFSVAFAAASLALSGCSDDNGFRSAATSENAIRVNSVWAMTGTASALPASYRFTTESLERPQLLTNGAVNFDVAFDITGDGRVALHPVRVLVPLPPAGAPVIGLQKSTGTFPAMERAPDKGYTDDSTVVVSIGELVLVRLTGAGCIYGDPFYAKLAVDSVIASERRIVFRSLVNRNCGFRALTEGLPKN